MHFTAGHLLFEMAAGYELTTRKPMEDDFEAVASKSSELVDVSQIVELPLIVLYIKNIYRYWILSSPVMSLNKL